MLLLVNGATQTVARQPLDAVGHLLSPRAGNRLGTVTATGRMWAADNDAFLAWDQERYWKMLINISKADRSRLLWVTVPDVVGNAQETINRWHEWLPQLDYLGLPAAFVGQDGLGAIADEIQWHELECFFIGGSDEWKLSAEAEDFAREAKRRGKWVHMGRVNSVKRMRHAMEIGCDSIDGRSFSAWPDRYQPWGVKQIKRLKQYRSMF